MKVNTRKIIGGILFGVPLAFLMGGLFVTNPVQFLLAVLVIACMAIGIRLYGTG